LSFGAIGSIVSGVSLLLAAYNDYGRLLTKFFMGYWVTSGMFHLQRTWIIYLLTLVIGLIFVQLGHNESTKICETKSSHGSLFIVLIVILLILSSSLLVQANQVNWRGEVVPYWDVCLFVDGNSGNTDWNTGILFGALTISILTLLGIAQISWGKIYLGCHQNSRNHNLIRITGLLHSISGIILLFAIFPIYLDSFGYVQFHFLLFVPFLVTQIISSITFFTIQKHQQ
jgi:hypothetical protein